MKIAIGYDLIAPLYDILARIVFGDSIRKSQLHFLKIIPSNSRVLIMGGGTGWLLTELLKLNPSCKVVYVEASQKMVELTKKKLRKNKLYDDRINFLIDKNYLTKTSDTFDVVITNFFLDLFKEESLKTIIEALKSRLASGGIWLLTEFDSNECYNSLWKKFFVKMMILFFKVTAGQEGEHLLDYEAMIEKEGFKREKSKSYYFRMIKSIVFVKGR